MVLGAVVDAVIVVVPCCVNDVGMTVVVVPLLVFWPLLGAVVAAVITVLAVVVVVDVGLGVSGDVDSVVAEVFVSCGEGVGSSVSVVAVSVATNPHRHWFVALHVHPPPMRTKMTGIVSHTSFAVTIFRLHVPLSQLYVKHPDTDARRWAENWQSLQSPCAGATRANKTTKKNIFA